MPQQQADPPSWPERSQRAESDTPGGDNDVLVSATTATPTHSRTSFSASLGTAKDAKKIGKNLFPVHRKATISSSVASKV